MAEQLQSDASSRKAAGVVVVTGASSGVGRATARHFAAHGWNVGLLARGREGLEAARREVEAYGRRGRVVVVDVSDAEAVERAAEDVERALGPIDVWINDAMVSVFAPVTELKADEIKRVTEVTYLGSAYGTMAALRRMKERDRGVIVQVGSALAYRSIPLQSAYCAAKHAIMGFTESLRCELLHDKSGVRVTVAHLPAINTPHFSVVRARLRGHPRPVAPVYEPELAAQAVYEAAHGRRREFSFGIMSTAAIQGNKFFPGLLDRYLAWTGYEGQQLKEAVEPGRPDNLWQPLGMDLGAHGRFGDKSASRSPHLALSLRRRGLLATGAVLLAGFAFRRMSAGRKKIRPAGTSWLPTR